MHFFRKVNLPFIQDDVPDAVFLKTQRGNTFFYFKIPEPYQVNISRILVFKLAVIFQELFLVVRLNGYLFKEVTERKPVLVIQEIIGSILLAFPGKPGLV